MQKFPKDSQPQFVLERASKKWTKEPFHSGVKQCGTWQAVFFA